MIATRLRSIGLSFLLLGFLLAPVQNVAAFDIFGQSCGQASDSTVCKQAAKQAEQNNNPVTDIVNTAANIIALIAGVAAVVMIIISGFKFITAGGVAPGQRSGDPNQIKSARATLTYSVIGLVVVALAWTITRFITDKIIQ